MEEYTRRNLIETLADANCQLSQAYVDDNSDWARLARAMALLTANVLWAILRDMREKASDRTH